MNRLNEILERQAAIQEELRELEEAETEASEDNPLPDDHDERVDALVAEFDTLDEERAPLAEREGRRSRVREAAVNPAAREAGTEAAPARHTRDPWDTEDIRYGSSPDELRSRAAAAVEGDRSTSDEVKQNVVALMERADRSGELARHILATGSPEYREAWAKMISGNEHQLTDRERQVFGEARDQSLTNNQGGFAVPALIDTTVILTNDGRVNPIRQQARTVQGTSNRYQVITSDGVSAAYEAEGTQVGESAMTIARPEIEAEKAHVFVQASIEITQDWSNLASELSRAFTDAKDDLEATAFTLGQGTTSSEPLGIVFDLDTINTSSKVGASTTSEYNLIDVYSLQEALPPRYQDNATWMASLGIINKTRQFGTANNYHGFLVDLGAGQPRQLLGQSLFQNSKMTSTITTGADVLVIGDFSRYLIFDRIGMSVEVIPHIFGDARRPVGKRGFYAYWRNGGGIIDANAFRLLELTA